MNTQSQIQTLPPPPQTAGKASRRAPRRQRSATAVIAQYIQDLTRPAAPSPCPAG